MEDIMNLRKKIDEVDHQILELLSERTRLCTAIGLAKKKQGLPIKDRNRENELYANIEKKAAELKLDGMHIKQIYRRIVDMCTSVQ
jgi:chorismate mutase